MNKTNRAEINLQGFIQKWQEHYGLSNAEVINLLLTETMNINDGDIKRENTKKCSVHDQVIYYVPDALKGVIFMKVNGGYSYISPDIDKYIKKRR